VPPIKPTLDSQGSIKNQAQFCRRHCAAHQTYVRFPRFYQVSRIKRIINFVDIVVPPIKPMLDFLGSIKKGQKIRKGKNQTKSKDIAVAKLHALHKNLIPM
jgi:hypothetical protein